MIGRDHKLTTTGLACFALTLNGKLQHTPLKMLFKHHYAKINTFPYQSIFAGLCFIIGATLTSTWPDIDSSSSKIGRILPSFLSRHLRHRGICHSLIGWLIFSIILYICFSPLRHLWPHNSCVLGFYCGMIFGYLMHLVEDSFSQSGIIWLYPFEKGDYKMLHKYGINTRPMLYLNKNGKPVRHWWGRGYKVGSRGERQAAKWINTLGAVSLLWLIL